MAPVVADTIVSVAAFAVGLGAVAIYAPRNDMGVLWAPVIGVPAAVVGGVYLGSSMFGRPRVRACRRALQDANIEPQS